MKGFKFLKDFERFLKSIYREKPAFFPHGAKIENFKNDTVELRYFGGKPSLAFALSERFGEMSIFVAASKNIRGIGLVCRELSEFLRRNTADGDILIWSVHVDNHKSIALAERLSRKGYKISLVFFGKEGDKTK